MIILGNIVVIIGILFMFFGVIGLFKFKNFYPRILVTAKIDTVGTITILTGLILKHGFGPFSLKLLLLLVIMLILNPLAAHMVARSAYLSGYTTEDETKKAGKESRRKDD
ncbi:MAG: monovalent cation/H(+) antiporter subunit G [Treponema sp.]|nr:monovalent cation/H(+) antiporter subunit G [Treponema sp.]